MQTIYRHNPHLEHQRRLLASQRRRQLGHWQDQIERIARTPIRSDEEREAKAEALARMMEARP